MAQTILFLVIDERRRVDPYLYLANLKKNIAAGRNRR